MEYSHMYTRLKSKYLSESTAAVYFYSLNLSAENVLGNSYNSYFCWEKNFTRENWVCSIGQTVSLIVRICLQSATSGFNLYSVHSAFINSVPTLSEENFSKFLQQIFDIYTTPKN